MAEASALITGIKGFAGSYLAEFLLAKGYHVVGLDHRLDMAPNIESIREQLVLYECDIRDAARVSEIVSKHRPGEIYHLAAIAGVPMAYRDVRLTFEVNVFGSLNIFEAVKATAGEIRVLHVGTAGEYGAVRDSDIPIHEDVALRPVDPYGVSKASADMLAYQYHRNYGLHVVRVRPFNHIGPRQSPDFIIANLAKQIAEIEKGLTEAVITIGNMEARRDLTDVRDMVSAYWCALQRGEPGEVYNICSGTAHSVGELLGKLLAIAGKATEVRQDPERLRRTDVPVLRGDCTRFRSLTGWKPRTPLDVTLREMLEHWRQNLAGVHGSDSVEGRDLK